MALATLEKPLTRTTRQLLPGAISTALAALQREPGVPERASQKVRRPAPRGVAKVPVKDATYQPLDIPAAFLLTDGHNGA